MLEQKILFIYFWNQSYCANYYSFFLKVTLKWLYHFIQRVMLEMYFLIIILKFLHLILDGDVLTKLKTYPNVEIVNELS